MWTSSTWLSYKMGHLQSSFLFCSVLTRDVTSRFSKIRDVVVFCQHSLVNLACRRGMCAWQGSTVHSNCFYPHNPPATRPTPSPPSRSHSQPDKHTHAHHAAHTLHISANTHAHLTARASTYDLVTSQHPFTTQHDCPRRHRHGMGPHRQHNGSDVS